MSDAFQTTEETTPVVKFEDLVGEGKKYRDPDAAAHAIAEKDRFIEQLKREAAEAREAAVRAVNERAFQDQLERANAAKSPQAEDTPPAAGTGEATAMKPEDVEKIIEQRETKKVREANLNKSISKLQELYGDDYKRHVARQAQEIGMSTADLTELASRSPEAFFRTLGITERSQDRDAFSAPPRSELTVPPTGTKEVKNYAYFQKLRAEKGEAYYFTPKVQQEMWNMVKQLGEDQFYKR